MEIVKTIDWTPKWGYVNKALRLDNNNPLAFKTRAEIFLLLNQKDKACSDISHAETLNTDDKIEKEIILIKTKSCIN